MRGDGYKLTRLRNDNFEQITNFPGKVVAEYMSGRSAELFLARENKMYYLAIKHINSTTKHSDASGAEIFINILICSNNEKSIRALCCEVYRNYSGFATALYNNYNDNDNSYGVGYSFDNAEITDYLNSVIKKNIADVSLNERLPSQNFQTYKKPEEVIKHLNYSRMPSGNNSVLFIAELSIGRSQLKERFSALPLIEISNKFRTPNWHTFDTQQTPINSELEESDGKKKTDGIKTAGVKTIVFYIIFLIALLIIIILIIQNFS